MTDQLPRSFKERAAALGLRSVPPPPPPQTNGSSALQVHGSTADTPYGLKALEGLVQQVMDAGQTGGRDNAFNAACVRAGTLIRDGKLTKPTAETALRAAGLAVSDPSDFTEYKVNEKLGRVIDQGISGSYQIRYGPPPETAPTLRTFTPDLEQSAEQAQAADDEFWTARPELDHLRTFARARMTSPWAVLGVALARVVVTVPAFHVLPPIVGSHASLNLFVALVGPSGGGKGAAENAAADALDLDDEVYTATVGSGEGIGHLYAHREKGEVVRDRDAVLFTVPEVDNLVALGSRQGATLMPQLRSAWSGERLGFSYADKNKALPLDRHTYRMSLVLGVQPGRAQPLLDDADGGTPQRFLWLPTSDPSAPDELPLCPEPLTIRRSRKPVVSGPNGLVSLPVCDLARTTIVENRRARLRGDGDALDGHSLLARLKTAAALALLDAREDVNDQDWYLASLAMTVSDHTRATVQQHLQQVAAQVNQARGMGEAMRAVQVSEHVTEAAITKTAGTLGRRLRNWTDDDGWASASSLRKAISSPQRTHFEDALERLLHAGQVETSTTGRAPRYRWKERSQ